jgi:hypothetical protein
LGADLSGRAKTGRSDLCGALTKALVPKRPDPGHILGVLGGQLDKQGVQLTLDYPRPRESPASVNKPLCLRRQLPEGFDGGGDNQGCEIEASH